MPWKSDANAAQVALASKPTIDDDDDTQRSPSNSRWRPGLAGVSVGVITPRQKSVTTEVACSVGKLHVQTVDESVQYIT